MNAKLTFFLILSLVMLFAIPPRVRVQVAPPQMPSEGASDMNVILSDGAAGADQALPPVTQGIPLSEAELAELRKRLPDPSERPQQVDFALREDSKPAPRPGEILETPFPPAPQEGTEAQPNPSGVPRVDRYGPQGDVNAAARISVTFSRPMVALGTVAAQTAGDLPIQISPAVPGQWRWIGTKTLAFEQQGRLPAATAFTVTVPDDVTDLEGNTIESGLTWTLRTSAPRLIYQQPYAGTITRKQDPFMLQFDQRVNREQALGQVYIETGTAGRVAVTPVNPADLPEGTSYSQLLRKAPEDTWLLLKPATPLPPGENYRVVVPKGFASAEGPLTTTSEQSVAFKTYGPFTFERLQCNPCTPGGMAQIVFSNPIHPDQDLSDFISLDPQVSDQRNWHAGSAVSLWANTQPNTRYRVRIKKGLKDIFDQTLEKDAQGIFTTGDPVPSFAYSGKNFVTLDPHGPPVLRYFAKFVDQFHLSVYRVEPKDFPAWALLGRRRGANPFAVTFGEKLFDDSVKVTSNPTSDQHRHLDLAPFLEDGLGQLLVQMRGPKIGDRPPNTYTIWVQATQIGLQAVMDDTHLYTWSNNLKDGTPLEGISLELATVDGKQVLAQSSNEALWRYRLSKDLRPKMLIARKGKDLAFLPESQWPRNRSNWTPRTSPTRGLWYVTSDRGIYKPGETINLKGWFRISSPQDGRPRISEARELRYSIRDARNVALGKGSATFNPTGGFDLSFRLPDVVNLGEVYFELVTNGQRTNYSVKAAEFRTPEFEISASTEPGPHLVGDRVVTTAKASYYAGGGLDGAEVSWTVRADETNYTPPGHTGYHFGEVVPFWRGPDYTGRNNETWRHTNATDDSGAASLDVHVLEMGKSRPRNITVSTNIQDINNQLLTTQSNYILHAGAHYVGAAFDRFFIRKDDKLELDLVVVDMDGKLLPGRALTLETVRLDYRNNTLERVDQTRTTLTSESAPLKQFLSFAKPGNWEITLTTADDQGRENHTRFTCWVAGGRFWGSDGVDQERVTIIPNQERYQPGDTAELLLQAPFADGRGYLMWYAGAERGRVPLAFDGSDHVVQLPIAETHIPAMTVQVYLDGKQPRDPENPDGQQRPAYAQGAQTLDVPPYRYALDVDVSTPSQSLKPGSESRIDVRVSGADGPVDVAVWMVDEAVLSLTDYKAHDPLTNFYPQLGRRINDYNIRRYVQLEDLDAETESRRNAGVNPANMDMGITKYSIATPKSAPMRMEMALEEAPSAGAPPIAVRTDFRALAVFVGQADSDGDGVASVPVTLPDNLTRYRVIAVAASGAGRFGVGDSSLTARLPLMVRPALPRFLNFGDRFDASVVIQNQDSAERTVEVLAEAWNAELGDLRGQRVTVPGNSRVRLLFPAAAAAPGEARFRFAAADLEDADAAEMSIPVWTPATTEATAAYGTIDRGAVAQPFQVPTDVTPYVGGLTITTTATALQALTDAVLYLRDYPYNYPEPQASRLLSMLALRDVLAAFSDDFDSESVIASVNSDIKALASKQNAADGGWGWWRQNAQSSPYLTVHVMHALKRAKAEGFAVPQRAIQQGDNYLRNIYNRFDTNLSETTKVQIEAYAVSVMALDGPVAAQAEQAYSRLPLQDIPVAALARLLPHLDDQAQTEAKRHLFNMLDETAASAGFVDRDDRGHLLSMRRVDALVLESLLQMEPDNSVVPKLVEGIMGSRVAGRWGSTQENVFVLLALNSYFRAYEAVTPDFVARVWLGDQYAGAQRFQGRSAERQQMDIPMQWLMDNHFDDRLILGHEGQGRLYYRLAMDYAPLDLALEELSAGFYVNRRYEAVDDPRDVRRDADGTWRIREGAVVRVVLEMDSSGRRNHVGLVDKLPAGLEVLGVDQPRLPDVWRFYSFLDLGIWFPGTWYNHINKRDERVEAMTTMLPPGLHRLSYTAVATTRGSFIAPPAKAEELYSPETFGRSASMRVVVE